MGFSFVREILVLLFCVYVHSANVTISYCRLQYPANSYNWTITSVGSFAVYGRVYAPGVTDNPDTIGPGIRSQLGWGSEIVEINLWSWQEAVGNPDYGPGSPGFDSNEDEYYSFLQPNFVGTFRYAYRFSGDDGANWILCDLTGAQGEFQVNNTGIVTVIPSSDTVPPHAATGLNIAHVGPNVTLSWEAIPENDAGGYDVYKRLIPSNFFRVFGKNNASFLSFNEIVSSYGTYEYYVVAFDTSYNYGNASSIVSFTYNIQTTGAVTTGAVTTGAVTTGAVTSFSVTTGSFGTTGSIPSNRTNPFTFPRCITINATLIVYISVNLCVDLQFRNCEFDFSVTANNQTVYSPPPYSITQFKNVFQEEKRCTPQGFDACDICTSWSNVTLNETIASGCGQIWLECFGGTVVLGPANLDCFSNSQVVPQCFGSCPNLCSFNGVCQNGFCNCSSPYSGTDCSVTGCPNSCGGQIRGTCVNNECVCKNGFQGYGCSLYIGESSATSSSSNSNAYIIGFVVSFGGLGLIVLVVVLVWYYRKKKNNDGFDGFSTSSSAVELE